jgi:hypothetical protein
MLSCYVLLAGQQQLLVSNTSLQLCETLQHSSVPLSMGDLHI